MNRIRAFGLATTIGAVLLTQGILYADAAERRGPKNSRGPSPNTFDNSVLTEWASGQRSTKNLRGKAGTKKGGYDLGGWSKATGLAVEFKQQEPAARSLRKK